MKKVIVISHERSGTSFLINTIAENFPHYLPEEVDGVLQRADLDGSGVNFADPEEMLGFLKNPQFHDLPIRNIFKSHHPFSYFEPVWDYLIEQFHVFYIHRDGRDVLASYWRHVRKQGFLWGPMAFDVSGFIRAKPSGAACRYQGPREPENMAHRWNLHIHSWMDRYRQDVCYISYEELSEGFEISVRKIGRALEMDVPEKIVRPKVSGVHPWRAKVGNWRDYFDSADEAFFLLNTKSARDILGMDDNV